MNLSVLQKLMKKGRIKAIIQTVAGRRLLFGFERTSKRSNRAHIKHLSNPIDVTPKMVSADEHIPGLSPVESQKVWELQKNPTGQVTGQTLTNDLK